LGENGSLCGLNRFGPGVMDQHRAAGLGGNLRNTSAHGARADDANR